MQAGLMQALDSAKPEIKFSNFRQEA